MPSVMTSRRRFLRVAAGRSLAAACSAPWIVPASALGRAAAAAPSERIRVGLIGCGGHGSGWNLDQIFRCQDVQVAALCDVDQRRLDAARRRVDDHYRGVLGRGYGGCDAYGDFRKLILRPDLDAIANCTPDHWHVIPAIMAVRCAKDVICEKPLTLFVEEGQILCREVRRHQRVFQTASENRSLDVYLRLISLVRSGAVGRLRHIEVGLPRGNTVERIQRQDRGTYAQQDPQPVPPELDYEMWLGQAPRMPYIPARTHGSFRWNLAFSGGVLTDWGAHMIDLAQWGHNSERSGPVTVSGRGDFPPPDAVFNTSPTCDLRYEFADGVTMRVTTSGPAIRFEGSEGWIASNGWRGALTASQEDILRAAVDEETAAAIYRPGEVVRREDSIGGEHRNFYDCVKSRQDCYAPAETGHRTITIAHIGNIAMQLGRALRWDPAREDFVDDPEASALLTRQQREPWTIANIDRWI
jgi:predicted dehydrogenase